MPEAADKLMVYSGMLHLPQDGTRRFTAVLISATSQAAAASALEAHGFRMPLSRFRREFSEVGNRKVDDAVRSEPGVVFYRKGTEYLRYSPAPRTQRYNVPVEASMPVTTDKKQPSAVLPTKRQALENMVALTGAILQGMGQDPEAFQIIVDAKAVLEAELKRADYQQAIQSEVPQ